MSDLFNKFLLAQCANEGIEFQEQNVNSQPAVFAKLQVNT